MSTVQPVSQEDLFVWPDGTQATRSQLERGEMSYLSDDYELVPVGTPRYLDLTSEAKP